MEKLELKRKEEKEEEEKKKNINKNKNKNKTKKVKPSKTEFEKDCLETHNKYRKLHDAEPLTIDTKVSGKKR